MNRLDHALRPAQAVAVCLGLMAAGSASAQSPAPAQPPAAAVPAGGDAVRFPIRGFEVLGDNPLTSAETTLALAPFLRSDATLEVLQQATAALEDALRKKGFGLHRVALPAQELGQGVRLEIVRFTIGKVSVEGLQRLDTDNVRASLPELQEGQSPNLRTLAVQTALANDNPSRQVQVTLRESERPDQIDAVVKVEERQPWSLDLSLSNAGNAATGRDRLTVAGTHHNLFNRDHQFTGAYTTSLANPSDVRQIGLDYRIPLYRQGATLGVAYTHSDVVGDFGSFTSRGAGHTWRLAYTQFLPADGGYRAHWSVAVEDKLFRAAEVAGVTVGQSKRSRPLSLGYSARKEADLTFWSYSAELAFNTGTGSGNTAAAYASENQPGNNRIDSESWRALRGSALYSAVLDSGWYWSLRSQWQWSPDALISGEQFGVGGASSVRGTGERVVAGDSGLMTSLELTTPELMPGLRLSGFVDSGWTYNRRPNGSTRLASDRLTSAGVGLRYSRARALLSLDWARVAHGSSVSRTFSSDAPQSGDHKLHVNLAVRF